MGSGSRICLLIFKTTACKIHAAKNVMYRREKAGSYSLHFHCVTQLAEPQSEMEPKTLETELKLRFEKGPYIVRLTINQEH